MGQKIKKRWFWRKKDGTRSITPYDSTIMNRWKDIAVRAAKTFLQAFLASLVVDISSVSGGWNVWRSALISAAAAGLSAVMNFAIAMLGKEDTYDIQTASDETGER